VTQERPFAFDRTEIQIMNGHCRADPAATRTVIVCRGGVTVERWDGLFVTAQVITAKEGALGPISGKYTQDLMGDGLPRSYSLWVAKTGGMGMFCYLSHLQVEVGFRRKGLGSWLLKQILDSCYASYIFLASNAGNGISQEDLFKFYERFDFERFGDDTCLMFRYCGVKLQSKVDEKPSIQDAIYKAKL
jgi:GNAT superfamily N-acetyltransferase